MTTNPLLIGVGDVPLNLLPKFGNRHGLIAGATGTGKTVTLQRLAEQFSQIGVPVFLADVKGDLTGICQPGGNKPAFAARAAELGLEDYAHRAFPVTFWDVFGRHGHPVRATISEMGPLLLSRLLDLNATQEGVLNLTFKLADDEGMLLLDLKDLRAMLQYVSEHAKELTATYGNVSPASIGAIQRSLLTLEQQGAEAFFGEPALELDDLMQTEDGLGVINILAADELYQNPRLYATFLLWLLSELFEELPEVGDMDQPKLVFVFDEAHLLFDDAPKALVDKVEQVVRLIRSKGVGVYFVTQNPLDIPENVLGQLGNRVQHALRAFTPRDQKAVRAAAETFRANPSFDSAEAILELGVGEALVSFLDEKGTPNPVQRAMIAPPEAQVGPADEAVRRAIIAGSNLDSKYRDMVDRDSAFEILRHRADRAAQLEEMEAAEEARMKEARSRRSTYDYGDPTPQPRPRARTRVAREPDTIAETMAKSFVRTTGSQLGRALVRGVLGSIFRGR
ncbi:MAG: helicase HerA-like domain-containing protein [Fimbriimonas sp.]